jgi:thiol-disulfide isomerase/thioredoxin
MLKIFFLLSCIMLTPGLTVKARSIESYPEIGKRCPEFVLKQIDYYSKKRVSLADFNGQYLILDFWNEHCSACIESFPEVNKLQKEFEGKVQIVLVSPGGMSKKLYERVKTKLDLHLATAYDSLTFYSFVPAGLPHVIYIDKNGIVKAITSTESKESIQSFIEGKDFSYMDRSSKANRKRDLFDRDEPLLTNGNGGNDTSFLYRSLLKKWSTDMPMIYYSNMKKAYDKYKRFEVTRIPVEWLYSYAYLGNLTLGDFDTPEFSEYRYFPINEISDSSKFKPNLTTGANLYCYSLMVPPSKASASYLRSVMQNDLQNYFGFIAKIETRKFTCYYLESKCKSKCKIETKGEKSDIKSTEKGLILKNRPMVDLMRLINSKLLYNFGPVLDKTEISGNIDFIFDEISESFDDVAKNLSRYGLELVKGQKEMKVLVISDK